MDNNLYEIKMKSITRTLKALEDNNMLSFYVNNVDELHELLESLIKDSEVVSVGGSMTLFETGTIDYLRSRDITFLDRYEEGLSDDDIKKIYREAFSADSYLASVNAVTETGHLYNVDGRGNRVAAMIYGPDKVILIAGTNKIVRDDEEAILRNEKLAAPANAVRLNQNTPCAHLGYCTDCNSPDRICSSYVFLRKQRVKNRIHVILIEGDYGY